MKNTVVLILALLSFSFVNLKAQADDPAIQAVLDAGKQFADRDAAGNAAAYTSDGILVNPLGMIIHGSAAIEASHEQLFNVYWKDIESHGNLLQKDVRYLSDDLALVTLTGESWYTKEGVEVERSKLQMGAVVKKHNDIWMIEYFHITPILSPGQG